MKVIGIDGWKGQWVAVFLKDGNYQDVAIYPSLNELLESISAEAGITTIGIDMPIGLTNSPPRKADQMAREAIGKRRSSVFDPPPRFCLQKKYVNDYRLANQESQKRCARGISAQSFALIKLIAETEAAAQKDNRFYEIHPELSFRTIKGEPLEYSKKTWNGQSERLHLLNSAGIHLPKSLPGKLGNIPPDDLLDAAAVAWSANRIANQLASSFPAKSTSQRHKIWY